MAMQQTITQRLANPTHFMALSARLLPWLASAAGVLIAIGLYLALFVAPPDYQQGQTAKIMYVHVPSAWLAMFGYMVVAASSFGLLVFRHPLADVSAKAAAPIGAVFTSMCLLTGMLWGKPMWGAFWVWDPRLTSVLILFLLYLGLIALRSSIEDESLAGKLTAVLALVGIVIIPVIKFSVDWNSLHQPASITRIGSPAIHASLLWPLLVMTTGMSLLFGALHLKAMRNEVLRRRVKALRIVGRMPARRWLSNRQDSFHGLRTARWFHLGIIRHRSDHAVIAGGLAGARRATPATPARRARRDRSPPTLRPSRPFAELKRDGRSTSQSNDDTQPAHGSAGVAAGDLLHTGRHIRLWPAHGRSAATAFGPDRQGGSDHDAARVGGAD